MRNLGREIDHSFIKGELELYIPEADYRILSQLGYLMLGREIPVETVEATLGSDIIENLLREIEHVSYEELKRIHTILKHQGLIK